MANASVGINTDWRDEYSRMCHEYCELIASTVTAKNITGKPRRRDIKQIHDELVRFRESCGTIRPAQAPPAVLSAIKVKTERKYKEWTKLAALI